jgi:hypothetical protein
MKKYIIIFVILSGISCAKNYRLNDCNYNYSVTIGNNLIIDRSEVENVISSFFQQNQSSLSSVEIIIYGNSSRKEIYTYSNDKEKEVTLKNQPGKIEALIKIKANNSLQDAIFIEADGYNRKEMLQKLAQNIRRAICR